MQHVTGYPNMNANTIAAGSGYTPMSVTFSRVGCTDLYRCAQFFHALRSDAISTGHVRHASEMATEYGIDFLNRSQVCLHNDASLYTRTRTVE